MIYLDWAASSIPDREILQEACNAGTNYFGNPSSEHSFGTDAQRILSVSREKIADCIDCGPNQIIFTSGGTEGNNIVLQHLLTYKKRPHIVASGIEHASIYETLRLYENLGFDVSFVSPDKTGILSPEKILNSLRENTRLLCLIAVHNETGAVQPVEEIASAVRGFQKTGTYTIHIHIDAVQALGKIPFSCGGLDIDSAVFSAHKIRGPKGSGFLYCRGPLPTIAKGGEQEFGMRPGTENLFSAYACSASTEKAVRDLSENYEQAKALMRFLLDEIAPLNGIEPFYKEVSEQYSPYINVLFIPPVPGETIVRSLDGAGIAVGTGSACSSSKAKRTRGLRSMGLEKEKYESAIRVSTGFTTAKEDIKALIDALTKSVVPLVDVLQKPLQ